MSSKISARTEHLLVSSGLNDFQTCMAFTKNRNLHAVCSTSVVMKFFHKHQDLPLFYISSTTYPALLIHHYQLHLSSLKQIAVIESKHREDGYRGILDNFCTTSLPVLYRVLSILIFWNGSSDGKDQHTFPRSFEGSRCSLALITFRETKLFENLRLPLKFSSFTL